MNDQQPGIPSRDTRPATVAASYLELQAMGLAALEVWTGGYLPAELRRTQAMRRLQSLYGIARERVPLYSELYRHLPPDGPPRLADLPVVTKSTLMADVAASLSDRSIACTDLEAFVRDPGRVGELFRGRYAVWVSSGTTGRPGMFLHDVRALAVYEALETLRFRGLVSFADYGARVLAGERFALVMVTGGHFASVSSAEHLRRTFPWLAGSIEPLSLLAPIEELVARLNAYRPSLLATYPTAAEVLAREQQAGRLRMHLTELWTGGEFLAPHVRLRLEQTFQCRVRDGYGASEFLSIGWSCEHGTLHINDDWVLLEPVDAAYRPVPPGTPSHTSLLTNLANEAQPLIRYDLGDSITLLPPCACGSSFPAVRVEGRRDDVLHLADDRGHDVEVLPLVLETLLEEEAGVYDFQITQTGAAVLRVALGPTDQCAGERALAVLAGYFARNRLRDVSIEVDPHPPRVSSTSCKLRRVVCDWNRNRAANAATANQ